MTSATRTSDRGLLAKAGALLCMVLLCGLSLAQTCHVHAESRPTRQVLTLDDGLRPFACPICLALHVAAVAPERLLLAFSLRCEPNDAWSEAESEPRRLALKLSCRPPPTELI